MKALFLSYDGMTDPLGQSQVVPYLAGLSPFGVQSHIVSFEKPAPFARHRSALLQQMERGQIGWTPLVYHKSPPILSTLWDLLIMGRAASRLHLQHGFDLVHCRSYVPCLIGERLQRRFHLPLLFDMRGFWADERVDAGIWARDRWPYSWMYRYFKRKERQFLCRADAVVTLTHAAQREISRWNLPAVSEKISVIPCCVDLQHFSRSQVDLELKNRLAGDLGLEPEDFVVVYLGSIGTWYALDEMLAFFARLARRNPRAKLLMITPDPSQQILDRAQRLGLPSDRLCFYHSPRSHVPTALALGKLALCFIKPFYSKIGSSPTKLAEYLSMGLPVVSNRVGDSDWLARYQLGPLLNDLDEASYDRAIEQLPGFLSRSPESYRKVAEEYFSLESGIQSYLKRYQDLVGWNSQASRRERNDAGETTELPGRM